MFRYGKLINIISAFIIGFIGFLFMLKYSEIYNVGVLPVVGYLIVFSGLIVVVDNPKLFGNFKSFIFRNYNSIAIIAVVVSVLFVLLTPRIGQIGRLPAIEDWINLYFSDVFPYNSPLTPSSFPALFFMAMPFHFTGTLGLFEVFGLAITLYLIKKSSVSENDTIVKLLLLYITPVLYYSFAVRCELVFNAAFLMLIVYTAEKYLNPDKIDLNFVLLALFFGVGLSIRSIAGILYAIYLLYKFRQNIINLIIFSAITIVVLIAFLVPFIIWDYDAFMNNGPFAIQSHLSNIPTYVSVIFLLAAILSGWLVSDLQEVFYMSGVLLFLMIILSFVFKINEFGFYKAFYEDKIDLSYLEFIIPLLVISVKDYKTDRFLGKMYN